MVWPVVMYRCESWTTKKAEFQRTAFELWCWRMEKTLENTLDCKETKPVHAKGNQSWIFTGRTDAEAEASILWPEELNHWKRPWCWERLKAKGGVAEDETVRQHHWLNGHKFEQTLGVNGEQRSLATVHGLQKVRYDLTTQ